MLTPGVGVACTTVSPDLRATLVRLAYAALTAFLFTLSAPALSSVPQDSLRIPIVYGKITDSSDGHSLAFASVTHVVSGVSNVSNSEGFFSLKLPMEVLPEDEIRVSFLGYVTATLSVEDFSGSCPDKPYGIQLPPVSFTLDPAVIRSIDPLDLFNEAYDKVKDNYPSVTTGMTAFYREIIRRQSGSLRLCNQYWRGL